MLLQRPDLGRPVVDEPRAESERSLDGALAIGRVHVEVDGQLDRGRLRHRREAKLGAVTAREPVVSPTLAAVLEQLGPKLANAPRISASEGDVVQPQQRTIPFRYTRAPASRLTVTLSAAGTPVDSIRLELNPEGEA